MKRFATKALITIASAAIVIAMTPVAEAQRERGRGGRGGRGFGRGGGVSLVELANADEVQAALNLSDEQKKNVDEINDELRAGRRELREQQGDRTEYRKLDEETSAKLSAALDETQNKRLLGILAQVDVNAALNNATIAGELNITDEQKDALAKARESNWDAMRKAFEEGQRQDLSREETRTKMNELRAAAEEKLLAALTSEQQAQFTALKGDPVKINMSQFRGRGGRGEGRGGREGRGERRRDRDRGGDEGAAESDSADRGA